MNINSKIREPINGFTHLLGAFLSLICLILMIAKATINGSDTLSIISVIMFGASLILLYSASATYHMVIASEKVIYFFRRLDHSMIFLLIAGSYTPFCLIALKGVKGYILFALVSFIAIIGIILKMFKFKSKRWLSTIIYIAMGWLSVLVISPLYKVLSLKGVSLLLAGGILYTVGGIIYAVKPSALENKKFGSHEIFHIFILLGSLCHFLCVFNYLL